LATVRTRVVKPGEAVRLLTINAVLLLIAYYDNLNLGTRVSYAVSEGRAFTESYSPFLRVSDLVAGGTRLMGSLTLDWTQVALLALLTVDAMAVFGYLRSRARTVAR